MDLSYICVSANRPHYGNGVLECTLSPGVHFHQACSCSVLFWWWSYYLLLQSTSTSLTQMMRKPGSGLNSRFLGQRIWVNSSECFCSLTSISETVLSRWRHTHTHTHTLRLKAHVGSTECDPHESAVWETCSNYKCASCSYTYLVPKHEVAWVKIEVKLRWENVTCGADLVWIGLASRLLTCQNTMQLSLAHLKAKITMVIYHSITPQRHPDTREWMYNYT